MYYLNLHEIREESISWPYIVPVKILAELSFCFCWLGGCLLCKEGKWDWMVCWERKPAVESSPKPQGTIAGEFLRTLHLCMVMKSKLNLSCQSQCSFLVHSVKHICTNNLTPIQLQWMISASSPHSLHVLSALTAELKFPWKETLHAMFCTWGICSTMTSCLFWPLLSPSKWLPGFHMLQPWS